MASKMTIIPLIALVSLAMLWGSATAQTGCTRTLMTLSPCLNYVTGNSSSPTASCCSQLSNVVSSQPQCLCLLLNANATSYGLNINQTLALQLPGACSVQTPPTSKCNAANAPSAAPTTQQSPPADASTQPSTIPSGSKTVPSVNGAGNGRGTYDFAVILLLLIGSCALSFAGF